MSVVLLVRLAWLLRVLILPRVLLRLRVRARIVLLLQGRLSRSWLLVCIWVGRHRLRAILRRLPHWLRMRRRSPVLLAPLVAATTPMVRLLHVRGRGRVRLLLVGAARRLLWRLAGEGAGGCDEAAGLLWARGCVLLVVLRILRRLQR